MPDRPTWRLLVDGVREPRRHFAVEEAILRGVDEGTSPETLRLRRFDPSVWVGVFQDPAEDVDLDACRAIGLPVVRRHNPGGAVYQDDGSFCFSASFRLAPLLARLGLSGPDEIYRSVGLAVAGACARYGVRAEVSPVNDVTLGGRKVYGSAQVQWGAAFAHSGTLLVRADLDRMARVLSPSRLKYADRGFIGVRERVVNLAEAAGRDLDPDEVMGDLATRLGEAFQVCLDPRGLLPTEEEAIEALHRDKFSRDEWNFPVAPRMRTLVAARARSGVVTLATRWEGGKLQEAQVRGDFLVPDPNRVPRLLARLAGHGAAAAAGIASGSDLPEDVRSTLARLLLESAPPGDPS